VFNLQGSEIIFILLLALVVLGPEKLPDAIRRFTRTYGELKKMGSGFQSELRSVLDEPVREVRETAGLLRDAADPTKITAAAASNPLGSDEPIRTPDAAGDGHEGATPADAAASSTDGTTPAPATPADGHEDATPAPATPADGHEDATPAPATPADGHEDATPAPADDVGSDTESGAMAAEADDVPAPVGQLEATGPEPSPPPTNRIAAANSSESLARRAEDARPADLDDADPTGPSDPTDADGTDAGATEGAGAGSSAARA
jgi:sec-independent protein translocase protein TatB